MNDSMNEQRPGTIRASFQKPTALVETNAKRYRVQLVHPGELILPVALV